jgi:uncharacterized membrane protein
MKMRWTIWGMCLLLVGSLLLVFSPTTVLAQEEKVEIDPAFSKLEGTSGTTFQFPVTLKYTGDAPKTFNLSVTGPQNWTVYITPDYPQDKMIRDIRLDPTSTVGEYIDVDAAPPAWLIPAPGEYKITLEVSSGTIIDTIQLTAVITASYNMSLTTPDNLLNTTAAAGKDNFFAIGISNTGSAPIDNITLSSDNPKGWTIEFAPGKINALNAGSSQMVTVNIKPPPKTIAGDYSITLTAGGNQISKDIQIRVTVETPTVWGWIGVGIIILVFAGLAFVFIRFSRR